jgi:hypothetical protein
MLMSPRKGLSERGWLYEDGILDVEAARIAAFIRKPRALTQREAVLTTWYLLNTGKCTADLVADRVGCPVVRAYGLMKMAKRKYGRIT